MPAIGEPLSQAEVAIIRRWIQEGAHWPEEFEAGQHWSYVVPVSPVEPQSENLTEAQRRWIRSPIDSFVMEKLQREGLSPLGDASPETQIRRVFFDLIGLPPNPDEVNVFVADPSDERFEQIVNELLQRPQFGERWARPWLDLARYADSHGFQRDNFREVWAYRDWVIKALNDDMSFQQFTLEQIAGDLLPNATESQKIATGFHRCTPTNVEAGSIPEETRTEQVIDRVNTTGAVWLGSTFECCQCHDHKYDPFSAKDYYRLLAFFNNTELEADRANPKAASSIKFNGPKMPISNPGREAQRAELTEQRDALKTQLADRKKVLVKNINTWAKEFRSRDTGIPEVHVLKIVDFQSGGAKDEFKLLDDGSLLLSGKNPPDKDHYVVTVETDLQNVGAIQLEALAHDDLPGRGPGRGGSKKANFVLNHFAGFVQSPAGRESLKIESAFADFSQNKWDVNGVLNTKARTGWAISPEFGKSHWAKFVLQDRLNCEGTQTLIFELKHDYGGARSIGCLRLSAITGNVQEKTIPTDVAVAIKEPTKAWSAAQRKTVVAFRVQQDAESTRLTKEIAGVEKEIADLKADTTLVMIELPEPRMAYVYDRGDYRKQGENVEPGTPAVLHPLPDGPADRVTLAKWLTDENNPLVARVTVNRWWAEMFGRGIVATAEDFGIKGDLPSHPQLLDWLAVEFMENGWSMKKLLKTIVLSSTYRQSSEVSEESLQRDDLNKLLARGPQFRMDAEMIRDNVLAASGLLSLKQFGPSIRPYQPDGIWSKVGGDAYKYEVSPGAEQYRRGLYVVLKRGAPYPSFINFDASARLSCTVQRSRTNTPLQALTLLNDPVYVDAAKAMAGRVLSEQPAATSAAQMDFAFQLCTARRPTDDERGILLDLFETQLSVNRTQAESVGKLTEDVDLPKGTSKEEFAAWCSITTTLINLHETITKQ